MRSPTPPLVVVVLLALAASSCGGASEDLASENALTDGGFQTEPASGEETTGEDSTDEDSIDDGATDSESGQDIEAATRPVVEIPARWDSEIDAVYNRYWLYWEAFAAAYGPPHVDPTYEPLRALSTDENWESLQEQMQEFVEDEVVLVLPDGSITDHMIRIPNPSVMNGEEGSEVILQDCWIDDFIQQTLDGDVVEEAREAKLMNVTMQVVGGEWRVAGVAEATPESDGYEQCQEQLS